MIKNTVPYITPKQTRNKNLNKHTNIFTLNIILHQLLTKQIPLKPNETVTQHQALTHHELTPNLKTIHLILRPTIQNTLTPHPNDHFTNIAKLNKTLNKTHKKLDPNHKSTILTTLINQISHHKKQNTKKKNHTKNNKHPSTKTREQQNKTPTRAHHTKNNKTKPIQKHELPPLKP